MAEKDFPILGKRIRDADILVFFDFEATEYTHRAIALGIVAYEKKPGELVPGKEAFRYRRLIKTSDPIGPIVESMTGITSDRLQSEGVSFSSCLKEVINLCRRSKSKAYLSYSYMDMKILRCSIGEESFELDFFRHVHKSYVDLHDYLSHFLVDERGQSLSIPKLLKRLSIDFEGERHDPFYDSLALAEIYRKIVTEKSLFLEEILKSYEANRRLDDVDHALACRLAKKETASRKDLLDLLEERI